MDFLSIRTGMRKRESPDATWPPLRFSATQLQSKKIAFLRQKNLNKIESAQDKDKASGSRLNPPILPFTSRRKPQKKYFSSGQSRFHELHKHFIALNFRSMMMFNKARWEIHDIRRECPHATNKLRWLQTRRS